GGAGEGAAGAAGGAGEAGSWERRVAGELNSKRSDSVCVMWGRTFSIITGTRFGEADEGVGRGPGGPAHQEGFCSTTGQVGKLRQDRRNRLSHLAELEVSKAGGTGIQPVLTSATRCYVTLDWTAA